MAEFLAFFEGTREPKDGFELSVPRRDAELVGHITDMATEPGKERLTHLL